MTQWSKTLSEWTDEKTRDAFLSVVFTWDLPLAHQRAVWLRELGYQIHAGGPAVDLMPDYLADIATCGNHHAEALHHHNPMATFTSRGCIRRCPFCAVWRTEGELRELDTWPIAPIICDNNLLACSKAHFDHVIDALKPVPDIDFNQGLDARLLTDYHANRLAELDCTARLAFDSVTYESAFMDAYNRLRKAGFHKHRIHAYVLIGFQDTPDDAHYRLKTVQQLGINPNPMRYNPLDAMQRDNHVSPGWTRYELRRTMRYWANLRYFGGIPFKDFIGFKS